MRCFVFLLSLNLCFSPFSLIPLPSCHFLLAVIILKLKSTQTRNGKEVGEKSRHSEEEGSGRLA